MSPRRVRALVVPLAICAVATAAAPGWNWYRIQQGDTLTAIAHRYHTTVAALIALNHLPGNGNLIYAGSLLKIPAPPAAPKAQPKPASRPAPTTTYLVHSGDTATAIAAHYHTTVAWIAAHNRLGPREFVYTGQELTVPAPLPPPKPVHVVRSYPPAVLAAAAHDRAKISHIAQPSETSVRALIVAAAHRFHVDPSVALAVGWQESGFREGVVSPADAIGVMQVLPVTGQFIAANVVHRPLNLFNAADNVTAGVALLGLLTHAAPLPEAIAGYYQGLGSVRENGMYADTKAYVADVLALRDRFR